MLDSELVASLHACIVICCRLQNLTEFDCYVKAFFYLASRQPRESLLEPFIDSATVEPLAYIQSMMAVMMKIQAGQATQAFDPGMDVAQLLQGLTMAVGRPMPSAAAVDTSLAVAEPDAFPCILASLGSGACFIKVGSSWMDSRSSCFE